MTSILLRTAAATLLFAAGIHADSRPGNFRIIGPGGGGAMFHPTISPHDPNTILVGCDMTGAYISHDGGQTWEKKQPLTELANRLWVNPYSPKGNRMLLIAGSHFIAKETSSGLQQVSGPRLKSFADISAGFQPDGKAILYVVGDDSAFVWEDGDTAWRKVSLGGSGGKMRAVATSLRAPQTAYLSYSQLNIGGIKWLGVAKTTDAGRTWNLVWKEDSNPAAKSAPNIHDAWITERFGPDWSENPLALWVADQDANLAYGTDLGRTMRTTDGGANWAAVYSRRAGNGWVSTGLDVTTTYGYHFD